MAFFDMSYSPPRAHNKLLMNVLSLSSPVTIHASPWLASKGSPQFPQEQVSLPASGQSETFGESRRVDSGL